MMIRQKRKLGWGTISLLLIVMGIAWSLTIQNVCIGDIVLHNLGVQTWSNAYNGVHYTVFYSMVFIIPALILSLRFSKDFGAGAGKMLSALIWMYLLLALLGVTA